MILGERLLKLFFYDFYIYIFYFFACLIYAFDSGGQSLETYKLSLTTDLSYTKSSTYF